MAREPDAWSAPYRVRFDGTENHLLIVEGRPEIGVPPYYRNDVGQLKLDAPYSHRDFRRPTGSPMAGVSSDLNRNAPSSPVVATNRGSGCSPRKLQLIQ